MEISKDIRNKVKYSDWLKPRYCDYLQLEQCAHVYQLIERITLNTSAELSVSWKIMWDASPEDEQLFVNLIVTAILIDKYLHELFKYSTEDREKILGVKLTNILHEYYNVN